jgi:hypothetical protein
MVVSSPGEVPFGWGSVSSVFSLWGGPTWPSFALHPRRPAYYEGVRHEVLAGLDLWTELTDPSRANPYPNLLGLVRASLSPLFIAPLVSQPVATKSVDERRF